jgi:hypothetical protein
MRDYSKGAYRIKEVRKLWAEKIQAEGKDPSKLWVQSSGAQRYFIVYDYGFIGTYNHQNGKFKPAK